MLAAALPFRCFPPFRRQLERLQASLTASTSQLKQAQTELAERDEQVAALQAEVEATCKRLHALQASWDGRDGRTWVTTTRGALQCRWTCIPGLLRGCESLFVHIVWPATHAPQVPTTRCRRHRPRLPPRTWWQWQPATQGCHPTSRRLVWQRGGTGAGLVVAHGLSQAGRQAGTVDTHWIGSKEGKEADANNPFLLPLQRCSRWPWTLPATTCAASWPGPR